MQGTSAAPTPSPDLAGRRAVEFAIQLLVPSEAPQTSLDALLSKLAGACEVAGAGLAGLADGELVARSARDPLPAAWPWQTAPTLVPKSLRSPAAITVPRPEGGSYLVTAAAPPGQAGWLLWLEDPRTSWDPAEAAALALVGQALARRLADTASTGWSVQLDRAVRQQRLEQAALVTRRLAHDFGNVLTGILGFTELSLAQPVALDSALHRYLLELHRSAQAGAQFTHLLRLFARRQPMNPRPTRLAAVCVEEEARVRPGLGLGVALHFDLPSDLPLAAIDSENLRVVLAALLDNACDAVDTAGEITVKAGVVELTEADCRERYGDLHPGFHVEVSVADSGPGLSPEVRGRLFSEPFFSTKPRRRGFGLAVAYGVLHAHRGGLRLAQGPRGLIAQFAVPVAAAAPAAPAAPPRGEKILVVDDDRLILQFVSTTLERAGYRVQAADGGAEALTLFRDAAADPVQLVLADVIMPEITGVELARRLRAADAAVRVLFMSGHAPEEFPQTDLVGGRIELLSKPFHHDGLLRAVRTALDRPAPRRPARGGAGESLLQPSTV